MLLKVGELAKRCGLTVRSLHHYDDIGLLTPSARSASGYRLYNRQDIARLHQIQALQRLGLSLTEVGSVLRNPTTQLPGIITQQLHMLTQQIEQATLLRQRLSLLQQQLVQGVEPDLGDWLKTLELMNMFDKYFTADEIQRLPAHFADSQANPAWAALAQRVQTLMTQHIPHDSVEARELARDWFAQIESDMSGDALLLAKFTDMHAQEPRFQQQSGVSPEMVHYIQQASTHDKLDIYARYLSADELAHVTAHYGKHIHEWPPLIADAYQAMQSGEPATSSATLAIARRWLALTQAIYGPNPQTSLKIREAHAKEPALLQGSLISDELMNYLRQAFMHLHGN